MKKIIALLISMMINFTLGAAFAVENVASIASEQKVPTQQQDKVAWKKMTLETAKAVKKNAVARQAYTKNHPIPQPKQIPIPAGKLGESLILKN